MSLQCAKCGAELSRFDVHCGACDAPIVVPDTDAQLDAMGISFEDAPRESESLSAMPIVRAVGQLGATVVGATIAGVASAVGVEYDNWKLQDNIRGGIERARR